jgi:hypothetical protein
MDARLRVRRARRDDLDRVRSLLGVHTPPAPRELKRWRRLVSTLREDLYLAEREDDGTLVGLAVIVYVRGRGPAAAIGRPIHGTSEGAARVLLDCARARAAVRGCERLEVQLAPDALPDQDGGFADALVASGWSDGPRTLVRPLSP